MFIRYIYIEEFNNIIKKQNINFKSKYIFNFDGKKLNCELNRDYIENFYNKYKQIDDLVAIIGKNTSGKSSILRAINRIYQHLDSKDNKDNDFFYIIIFEVKEKLICYYYMPNNIKLNIIVNADIRKKIEVVNKENEKFIAEKEKTKFIYYSSVFDKNIALFENTRFKDISSNKVIRESINRTYHLKRQRWMNTNNPNINNKYYKGKDNENIMLMEMETEQFDFIDEFRKSEVFKKMKYYNVLLKRGLGEEKELLFKFPEKLFIIFADNFNIKDKFRDSIRDEEYKQNIEKLFDIIEQYTLDYHGYYYNNNNKHDNLIIQFGLLIFFEAIFTLSNQFDADIYDVVENFVNNIDSKELTISYINKNILKFLNKKIIIEDDEKNYDFLTSSSKENSFNSYLEEKIKALIEKLEESVSEDNELGISEKSKQIINEVVEIVKDLEDIKGRNNIIYDNKMNEVIYFQELNGKKYTINEYINNLVSIIPDIDNDRYSTLENNNKSKKYLQLLYEQDDYDSDIFLEFIEELTEKLNDILAFICYENIEIYDKGILNNNNKEIIYEETDQEIIKYVKNIINIIDSFVGICDKNYCISYNSSDLVLETKWGDKEVLKFLDKYYLLKIQTFNMEFENERLSSGQIAYFEMQSRLYDLISRGVISKTDENIVLLIDEGDIYLHPGIQINFITNMLEFLEKFLSKKKVQVIITSNSPFIISDIPNSRIIYINRDEKVQILENQNIINTRTFGSPINDLLINSFFMEDGIVGTFAQKTISEIIQKINQSINVSSICEKERLFKIIDSIGDSIIRGKLLQMYNSKFTDDKHLTRVRIDYYKKKIKELKERL